VIRRERISVTHRRQGRQGLSTNTVPAETVPAETVPADTSRQGRGMFHPPPLRAPPPRGAIPHRYTAGGDEHQPPSRWIHHQDPVSHCSTAILDYRQSLARPLEGAGGGAERAGRWGLVYVNRSTGDTPRQGRGMFHPPPRQPLPHGGDCP